LRSAFQRLEAVDVQEGLGVLAGLEAGHDGVQVAPQQADVEHGVFFREFGKL
jgi:hypothetical protein